MIKIASYIIEGAKVQFSNLPEVIQESIDAYGYSTLRGPGPFEDQSFMGENYDVEYPGTYLTLYFTVHEDRHVLSVVRSVFVRDRDDGLIAAGVGWRTVFKVKNHLPFDDFQRDGMSVVPAATRATLESSMAYVGEVMSTMRSKVVDVCACVAAVARSET